MTLLELHMDGFGKFENFHLTFGEGINIIHGNNEAGKTTLHTCLHAMLYGFPEKKGAAARKDLRKHYQPWTGSSHYSCTLKLEYQGHIYRIFRSFSEETPDLSLYDETDGFEITDAEGMLSAIRNDLSETAFASTVSIGQLRSATGKQLNSELKTFLQNLNSSGSRLLNVDKACAYLSDEEKRISAHMSPDAAKSYTALISDIRQEESTISGADFENHRTELYRSREAVRIKKNTQQKTRESIIRILTEQNALLQQFGLSDPDAVKAVSAHAEQLYQTYIRTSDRHNSIMTILLPLILFLSSAALVLLAVYLVFTKPSAVLLISLFAGLGFIFILLGIWRCISSRKNHQEMQKAAADLSDILQKQIRKNDISAAAMSALDKHFDHLLETFKSTAAADKQLSVLSDELDDLNTQEQNYDQALQRENDKQIELEGRLQHLITMQSQTEQFQEHIYQNNRWKAELDAIQLARETLTDLQAGFRTSFGVHLNDRSAAYIKAITNGRYDSIWISDAFDIYLNTREKLVSIDEVSSGSSDQIYLAVRLALSDLLQNKADDKLPLVFDDAFAMYDDSRLFSVLQFLQTQKNKQILLFTCQNREQNLLDKALAPYNLLLL